ncbi:reversion-inducing cysteine-rich protein with Kazal motifs [Bactrocera neohumeralis]|uniref:reversion-inducing cysteine-rich protein with Kazal motifs n=1 Tax=Bactrocera neohumeralis TaxID=98809 RepID=UPI0021666F71|nr:reversion-inducing cysteine-rich protein with Kazal motifs [Bactrocera neohumeralis]XP_050337514.1 reversion-inducing cysteine-rich protein with Kazal motifs [Bactrocera neohumeralis]XP_050337515.1 reversion-inducing cysteine-rich protein with Kazal motifs [Bactrocera neohumeralis]XP_050337516.1 reversion-inducing cysteine-rich protein with Kazal motifs [Bactrocera neohumeralis]XP_050337518.1 reversion-inducing cysteine-rich protein with Kazal motifs [Bactrocera neohumeralis]XP_050337519.1 
MHYLHFCLTLTIIVLLTLLHLSAQAAGNGNDNSNVGSASVEDLVDKYTTTQAREMLSHLRQSSSADADAVADAVLMDSLEKKKWQQLVLSKQQQQHQRQQQQRVRRQQQQQQQQHQRQHRRRQRQNKKSRNSNSSDDIIDVVADGDSVEVVTAPYANTAEEWDDDVSSSATSLDDNQDDKVPYDIYTCCSEVFGSCRTSCENLSLVQLASSDNANGRSLRLELKKYCPSMQTSFWSCMNLTLEAVARGAEWSGRRCCALGLSPRCRNACATSESTTEPQLISACRKSDEQHMFACFEHQETGDRCCSTARTSECLQACRDVFESQKTYRRNKHHRLHELCHEKRDAEVLQCINNITGMTPVTNSHKYLPCCEFSKVDSCRSACRSVLNSTESIDIIIGELEVSGCGILLPHIPLWQCFLTAERTIFVPATKSTNELSQINQIGIDSAKLHCCEKAKFPKCRRLCMQTYSNDWTATRAFFEESCLLDHNELKLRQCMDEVDEPCELGCDGLSFCTNFNNRPTELFRSCNADADLAARSDLKMWQQNGSVILDGLELPIKNMTRCAPEQWKAIACALQIKPCTRDRHYNHICREDCYEILSECMDWTRMRLALNADSVCARLSPNEDVPCVSLRPYREESDVPKETGGYHGLTAPCKGHPCNASAACLTRRNESNTYECVPGCRLGEASNYLVPFGAYVRIPVLQAEKPAKIVGDAATGAFKVCRCGAQGRIEHCQPLPSFSYARCLLPGGRSYEHGKSFYLECNLCSCFAGEITCTKKQCRLASYLDPSYTSLPCNCPTHFVPVCGSNGNTYHSACIAKCLGMQDNEIQYGACATLNPCREGAYSCPAGHQCLEQRKICLSSMHRPCLQYQCVNLTAGCASAEPRPVCDKQRRTHNSACDLLAAHATLAHWGACFRSCSMQGPVCGINGVTYTHECAAWADYIVIDYRGRCRQVGLLVADMGPRCNSVRCPRLPSPHCRRIVPPGACCAICAGAFRVVYSRKQIDRALYAVRAQNKDLITLHSVLQALDALVQFSECQLTGFLTMEVGIFVALVPRATTPMRMQVEACAREAERISLMIESQSHEITTNLLLSGLIVSHLVEPSTDGGGARLLLMPSLAIIASLAVWTLQSRRVL